MEHLNPQQIKAYHDRSLAPQERLLISRHIAACEPCRLALLEAQPQLAKTSLFTFAEETSPKPNRQEQHLEYEEKIDFLEGKLSPEIRAIAQGHLEVCDSCRAEVDELRTFRAVLSSQPTTPILPETPLSWGQRLRAHFKNRALWVGLQWCGAAAAGAVLMFLFGPSKTISAPQPPGVNPEVNAKIAQQLRTAEERANSAQQDLKQERAASANAQQQVAALTKELADWKTKKPPVATPSSLEAGQQITNRRGQLLVAVAVDRSDAKALEGKITLPSVQIALLNKQGAQMGGPEEQVKQRRPQATFVASLRPALVWEAVPGAKEYEIHIVDNKQNTDAVQQTLPASASDHGEITWQVPSGSALQPATVYRWYVRALNAEGNDVIAPAKREFRFQTLPVTAIEEIERKRSLYANVPLLLGGLYMRYGVLDEAESVLQSLPNNPTALQLRKQIKAARRP